MFCEELQWFANNFNGSTVMLYFDPLFCLIISVCVHSIKFKPAKFGVMLEGRAFVETFTESAWKCMENCAIRPRCESINYLIKLRICQLNTEKGDNSGLISALGWLYLDQFYLDQFETILPVGVTNGCSLSEAYNIDTQSCETRECSTSEDFNSVHANGNIMTTGGRALLSCPNKRYPLNPDVILTWPVQSVCGSDGLWTVPSIECGALKETCPSFLDYDFDSSWSGLKKFNNIRLVTGCNVTATFTASATHLGQEDLYGPDKARLDSTAWVGHQFDPLPYIQITFDKKIRTTGITTLARPMPYPEEFVTSYNVTYGTTVNECLNEPTKQATNANNMTTFEGNLDNSTEKLNDFFKPINLRCVRLYPVTYTLSYYPSTRLDVLASVKLPYWKHD